VLYLGPDPVPGAADAVAAARAAGMAIGFVTNNSSRRASLVAGHLTDLGIPASPEEVITSSQAVTHLLRARLDPGARVLVVGSDDLLDEIDDAGFAAQRTADGAVAVVQGLDPATSWLDLAEASVAIRAGALWVAGNRDSTYPSPRGPLPGNGALVMALVETTGLEPVVVGKPEPELYRTSLERVGGTRPLFVGDRLDTDVLGANRAGMDSLLVLTGVTDLDALLAAPEPMRPTYVSSSLTGLLDKQARPVVDGGSATCGNDRAWYDGKQLQRSSDSDDALRAACALAWSR
jgi:HAD superfamily hydrolase (TIGR01450 family)